MIYYIVCVSVYVCVRGVVIQARPPGSSSKNPLTATSELGICEERHSYLCNYK